MKTLLTLLFIAMLSTGALLAQEKVRPYTKDELARITQVCTWFQSVVPQSFQDWKVDKSDCADYGWAQSSSEGAPLVAVDAKGKPITSEYTFNIRFTNESEDLAQDIERAETEVLAEAVRDGKPNPDKRDGLIATSSRLHLCGSLAVKVSANLVNIFELDYQAGTTPQKLDIPVPGFAYAYMFTPGKPIHNEKGEHTSAVPPVDKVLIVLSEQKPTVTTRPPDGQSTFMTDVVTLNDLTPTVSRPREIRNIIIECTGDIKNIKAFLAGVNWSTMASFKGK